MTPEKLASGETHKKNMDSVKNQPSHSNSEKYFDNPFSSGTPAASLIVIPLSLRGHHQELASENALFSCLVDLGLTGAALLVAKRATNKGHRY